MRLRKTSGLCLAAALLSTAALADSLVQTATLKDLQTVGTTSKKQKHQQYDLVIDTSTNEYVCRTKLGSSLKPTQFVVGSSLQFKLNGQNGEATTPTARRQSAESCAWPLCPCRNNRPTAASKRMRPAEAVPSGECSSSISRPEPAAAEAGSESTCCRVWIEQ